MRVKISRLEMWLCENTHRWRAQIDWDRVYLTAGIYSIVLQKLVPAQLVSYIRNHKG